jgi:hypothetical protein
MCNPSCNSSIAVVDFTHTHTKKTALAMVVCLFVVGTSSARAQGISMELDTAIIALGDQTTLTVRATRDPMDGTGEFRWPYWQDTLSGGLEIIEVMSLDTSAIELPNGNAGIQIAQELLVTHWDSGLHSVGPISIGWNDEILKSNAVALQVLMPQPGKPGEIAGHAPIRLTQWSWAERLEHWLPKILVLLAVLTFAVWAWRKWKLRDPVKNRIIPERKIPLEPAHVIALRSLEEIQKTAVWKKGQIKTHHAGTSEALRLYLEHRFNFPALERSTAEIKNAIGQLPLRQSETEALIEVLTLADLVKFAKWSPAASDHERIVSRSIRFVENTIPVPESAETEQS